jgi:hypothetical protein
MALTTVSARDFARDFASAKKAANSGPVIVTDRGRPTYALLKIEDYYKLTASGRACWRSWMPSPGGTSRLSRPVWRETI